MASPKDITKLKCSDPSTGYQVDESTGFVSDVDGCSSSQRGCNDDAHATCSLGDGVNSRTCTCGTVYHGTEAGIADNADFSGCTGALVQ